MARAQADARNGYSAVAQSTRRPARSIWQLSRIDNAGGTGSLSLANGTLTSAPARRAHAGGSGYASRARASRPGSGATARASRAPGPLTRRTATGRAAAPPSASSTVSGLTSPFPDTGFTSFDAVDLNTSATMPSAPSLTAATGGNGSVSLQWSAPASDGGSTITNYKIYRGSSSGTETLLTQVGNVTSFMDTGVANGSTYWYEVSAVNAVGEGPLSGELSATPQAGVPGAPSLTAATGGNGSVSLQWSAPASDGGSAITNYKIYRGSSSGTETLLTQVGNVTSFMDTGVANGSTYWYEVSAVNAAGEGPLSGELSATPQAGVPGAPSLTAATGGNGSVSLQWSAPASDGGSTITNYKIYRGSSSGTETLLTQVGNVTSFMDTGVANGSTYWYEVSAVNAAGEGPLSGELSATPQAGVPGAPSLTAATGGNGSVSLQWSAPASDGGSTITNYKIYRGSSSGTETLLTQVGNVTSFMDTGVANGSTYWYEVSAVNAAGEGPLSGELSATPQAGVPGAPSLTAATGGNGSVSLQWSAPASDGGSTITNYKIYRGSSSGTETLLTQVGNVTSFMDTGVANGSTYWYEVSAVNAAGEGPLSGELSATPQGASSVFLGDLFERTVAAGLGTADIGGTWSVSLTSRTKVDSGEAVIYGWTGGGQEVWAWTSTARQDMELLALVHLNATNPVGANYQVRVMARAQADARNGYSARISHTTAGAATWGLSRIDNAGGTGSLALASGTLLSSGAADTRWWIRLRVQGTSIQAKFWRDGTSEPSAWKAQVTDSYWTSGSASLGASVNAGIVSPFPQMRFGSFEAVDVASP